MTEEKKDNSKLVKSKERVRNHGEVFTPKFIVDAMLDLVQYETVRIESKFLEPACGSGNFLIAILERKIAEVERRYKRVQSEFEFYTVLAVASIYGIDLLSDNIQEARLRLATLIKKKHLQLFKKKRENPDFEQVIDYILQRNLIQGNALSLQDDEGLPLLFCDRTSLGGYKIKRRIYQFEALIPEGGQSEIFIPEPVREYPAVYFLSLYEQDDAQLQSRCLRSTRQSEQ